MHFVAGLYNSPKSLINHCRYHLGMALTKKDKAVLRLLVRKEREALSREGNRLVISNSPFITKVALDEPDVDFLKSQACYRAFLKSLEKKL